MSQRQSAFNVFLQPRIGAVDVAAFHAAGQQGAVGVFDDFVCAGKGPF